MARIFGLFCFILVCFWVGCGSEQQDRTVANASNASSSGSSSVSNTSEDPTQGNSTGASPNTAARNKKLKDIQAAGGDPSVPKPDVEAVLKGSERPAPEDSLFAVALVDNVVERRIFLKHPTLKIVEKVTTNDGRSSLKVVTRDGRSFDLDGNAVGPVSTATSFTILRAIGLEGPTGDRKLRPRTATKKN